MSHTSALRMLCLASLLFFVTLATSVHAQQSAQNVIITTPQPYSALVKAIQQRGGSVKAQYKYVNAIAATIPANAMPAIRDLVGEGAVIEDSLIVPPRPVPSRHGIVSPAGAFYASATVGAGTQIFNTPWGLPQNPVPDTAYAVDLKDLNVRQLQLAGITGRGVIVAVIDSGVRPGYYGLDSDGSVIGGENFVPDGPSTFFSSPNNDPHGTLVSTLISGNALFFVPPTSAAFIASMNANFPGTLQNVQGSLYLPLIGSAPESSIYAIRIFGNTIFAGAPTSRAMSAIESVIDLRDKYDHGVPGGVNIKICNLSFGTETLYAGHTPIEQLVDQLLAKDIVPVIAAGDFGPSSLTISSPATAFSSLTVGGTSPAANERLWRDMSGDFNASARPSSPTQTWFQSSRGPTADGRSLPDVMAVGNGVMSQGCGGEIDDTATCIYNPNSIDVARGTSFSAPIVAGIAALLRQKFPTASAGQIWNAIVNGANNSLLGDDSTVLDQGQGLTDALASANLLERGKVSDQLPTPPKPNQNVPVNIQRNTDLHVDHGTVKESFNRLKPGERGEILYEVQDHTNQLTVDLSNIKPTLPPDQQNPFFGDDIFLNIHSAATSATRSDDYIISDFFTSDASFVIPNPEPGVLRITLMGDNTNAGTISADVMVSASMGPIPQASTSGTISTGDNLFFSVDIPAGVKTAQFQVRWSANWDNYPTNDLDMYLLDPSGVVNAQGASIHSPENAFINNPMAGTWNILIQGFNVFTGKDKFDLSIILDGKVVKIK